MKELFEKEKIEYFGVIPFSVCSCRRPDIIERRGVPAERIKTAVMLLIPYFVDDGAGNVSFYARSCDYHEYCEGLFARLIPVLEARFGERFLGFADKSPIQENVAASMAGLGVLGDNFMLINEKYGSFVFVAEILSTAEPETLGFAGGTPAPSYCPHCGACRRACPMTSEGMECLSAVTQKRARFPRKSRPISKIRLCVGLRHLPARMSADKGGDGRRCADADCVFHEDRISVLTEERLSRMDETEFRRRAFSWRGREPLLRNLKLLEK